jgi:hypothetical protein
MTTPAATPVVLAPTVTAMLASARRGLTEAAAEANPGARYVTAHLAALRAAAAVVAAKGPQSGKAGKPRSVWELLIGADPELAGWASYFAAGASKRAAAEAGLPRAVNTGDADNITAAARTFVILAEVSAGLPCACCTVTPAAHHPVTPCITCTHVRPN